MVGASFTVIGKDGAPGIWLSQLKIDGYLDSDAVKAKKGTGGNFSISILNANGGQAVDDDGYDMTYSYYHTWDTKNSKWKDDAGWYNEGTGDDVIEGEDTDVWIPAGTGLWFATAPAFYTDDGKGGYKEKYSLMSAGEAIIDALGVTLRRNNLPTAVPGSFPVMVSKLAIDGYLDSDSVKAKKGPGGNFSISILNANGGQAVDEDGFDRTYSYYHTWDNKNSKWKNDAGWYNEGTGEDIIEDEDTDVQLEMGEGLWFATAPAFYTDDGKGGYKETYKLVYPGIEE